MAARPKVCFDRIVPHELMRFARQRADGLPSLIIAGPGDQPGSLSRSDSHGGFDNAPGHTQFGLISYSRRGPDARIRRTRFADLSDG